MWFHETEAKRSETVSVSLSFGSKRNFLKRNWDTLLTMLCYLWTWHWWCLSYITMLPMNFEIDNACLVDKIVFLWIWRWWCLSRWPGFVTYVLILYMQPVLTIYYLWTWRWWCLSHWRGCGSRPSRPPGRWWAAGGPGTASPSKQTRPYRWK